MKSLMLMAMFVGAACANMVTFGTGVPASVEGNSWDGTNLTAAVNPAWRIAMGNSRWETTATSSTGVVDYWFLFTLAGVPDGGGVSVLSTGATRVALNGQTLYESAAGFTAAPWAAVVWPLLVQGQNRIDVFVSGGAVDVYGTASGREPSQAPEPWSFALVGAGLLALGVRRRRGVKQSENAWR